MQPFKQFRPGHSPVSLFRYGCLIFSGCVVAAAAALAAAAPAQAQAAYGSYVGAGAGFGLTSGGGPNEGSETSANIAVRYKFLKAPISVRTQVLVGDSTAIVPTVSYDFPLSWNADAYIGAGASIVTNSRESTPVGNETAVVIQPGVDYALPNSQFVVFGNAIIAFDAYKSGGGTAVSIQGGVGLRF